jgi:hypothetical protein
MEVLYSEVRDHLASLGQSNSWLAVLPTVVV